MRFTDAAGGLSFGKNWVAGVRPGGVSMTAQQFAPLIGLAVAAPLILLRNRRPRTLHVRWLWVAPAITLPLLALALWGASQAPGAAAAHFGPLALAVLAAGLALGAVAGWWRGRAIRIEQNADGSLKAQGSPLGFILIFGLLLGRTALRSLIEPRAAGWGLDAIVITDAFILFAVGLIAAQRLEMYLRARRILDASPRAEAPRG